MELWTYQGGDFNITSDSLDLTKSEWNDQRIIDAYYELAHRLGQEQPNFIWCVPRRERTLWPHRKEWVLDVPQSEWIVDAFIWNKIIGHNALPQTLREKWREEAIQNGFDIGAYERQETRKYEIQLPPEGGWWALLFITDLTKEGVNVLLKLPVPTGFIKKSPRPI